MSSDLYFPDHRHLMGVTLLQRERLLPEDVDGKPERPKNSRVSIRDVVARGVRPAPYIVIEAARDLRLRKPEQLEKVLRVQLNEEVRRGSVVAGKVRRNGSPVRGKSVVTPRGGTVVYIGQGRIIIQEIADPVAVESGLNGTIVAVSEGRGVTIETYAAVMQGVWGNNKRAIGIIRAEPNDGLEQIFTDEMNNEYRGAVVVTRRSLQPVTLDVIESQGLAGVIAPSMPADPALIERAFDMKAAILLTEGFGSARMNTTYFQFFGEVEGRQVMIDAALPSVTSPNPPEAIITVPLTGERPLMPPANIRLRPSMEVHVVNGDGSTVTGTVVDLPKDPVILDNGLRVPCAFVELSTGETRYVPLANLEVYG